MLTVTARYLELRDLGLSHAPALRLAYRLVDTTAVAPLLLALLLLPAWERQG